MAIKYKTKPCTVEAIQFNGLNIQDIKEFAEDNLKYYISDTAYEAGVSPPCYSR